MTLSVNEVQSFSAKAARGAGFPAGQSDWFGRASAWHIALGGDISALEQALRTPDNSPILRLPLLLQDIQRVCTLAGPKMTLSVPDDDTALLPAYLKLLTHKATAFSIETREDAPALLHLCLGTEPQDMTGMLARLSLPGPFLSQLQKLGAKRLVPASDQSRKGAGA